jgi:ATP-dependent HslUV protease ATP-binding subunit HslU
MMERLIEELSFTANDRAGESILIDAEFVANILSDLIKDEDLSRFIL